MDADQLMKYSIRTAFGIQSGDDHMDTCLFVCV